MRFVSRVEGDIITLADTITLECQDYSYSEVASLANSGERIGGCTRVTSGYSKGVWRVSATSLEEMITLWCGKLALQGVVDADLCFDIKSANFIPTSNTDNMLLSRVHVKGLGFVLPENFFWGINTSGINFSLPGFVSVIDPYCFAMRKDLTALNAPGVISIGEFAFTSTELSYLLISSDIKYVDEHAFYRSPLATIGVLSKSYEDFNRVKSWLEPLLRKSGCNAYLSSIV